MSKPKLDELMESVAAPKKGKRKAKAKSKTTKAKPRKAKEPEADQVTVVSEHNAPAEEPAAPPSAPDTRRMARALFVRRFVTEYLRNNMNASAAVRELRPDVSQKTSWTMGCELLQEEDVRTELHRQLRGIFRHEDMNEEWVYRHWRAMANSNIFDYVTVDSTTGKASAFRLSADELTLEQQLNVRELKFDKETRQVTGIKLVDREGTIANVAKAQRLFRELEDESLATLAKDITELMQKASKRIPRTFDNDTGEEI